MFYTRRSFGFDHQVSYDGQETVQPPLTLAEHLAKQAGKINFDEVDEAATKEAEGEEAETEDGSETEDDDDEDNKARKRLFVFESCKNRFKTWHWSVNLS